VRIKVKHIYLIREKKPITSLISSIAPKSEKPRERKKSKEKRVKKRQKLFISNKKTKDEISRAKKRQN
jgi:hypothetical protein|tara:strand:+ start:355 stop:558 length:204 start_codon:yes stop_codon:yes gene_type:complete